MPDIELRDLNRSTGTELFADNESFLEDLSEDAANIVGGTSNNFATIVLPQTTIHPQDRTTTHHRPLDLFRHPVCLPLEPCHIRIPRDIFVTGDI